MNKINRDKYTIKHSLKRILIKYKLLPCIKAIYEASAFLLPKNEVLCRKILNFYSQFIKKGDLCFDVGAHKGNRAAAFLKIGARVIAVEPQKSCIKFLQSKFGKNPNFVLVGKGLAESEGELTMSICEEADDISTFSEKWKMGRFSQYEWNKKELTQVTTLDNLIKEFGPPIFCKIDVEGFEYQF
jgi:FkbM family methyltransferase